MYRVLAIADLHAPFTHKQFLPFCKKQAKKYQPNEVVFLGDLVDQHATGRWDSDPDGYSAGNEALEADKILSKWYRAFPKAKLCIGNHDERFRRNAFSSGIASRYIVSMRMALRLPDAWGCDFRFKIKSVLYKHSGKGGIHGHFNSAKAERMSTVIGHLHSVAAVSHSACHEDIIFGMCPGCGIDKDKYAFAYGREMPDKPILACGLVEYKSKTNVDARVITMDMGSNR